VIDFRYHLVSIIAVFLALAVGIALGSGPLKDPIHSGIETQAQQLASDKRQLRSENDALKRQEDYSSKVTRQIAPTVTAGRLTGRRVVLVTASGADNNSRDQLAAELSRAGATVAATVALTDAWTDSSKEAQLDDVSTRLVPAGTPAFPSGPDARRQRVSMILSRGLVASVPAETKQVDPAVAALLSGLQDAGFLQVSTSEKPLRRADLAVVLAAPAPDNPDEATATANSDLSALAGDLDAQDLGTVVAGPPSSDAGGGLVAAVRAADAIRSSVSTVDAVDTASGQIAAVLALVTESKGTSGAYGYGPGATAALPKVAGLPAS
jgi:Copper transport outer membrane protein, MctB